MIRSIEATGFKSLIDFRLELLPGLNVLVGPNGAGKTNILKLMEFISETMNNPLSEAVSNCGGAGELFFRDTDNTLRPEIKISVSGSTQAPRFRGRKDEIQDFTVFYDFEATVRLTENSVYYYRQTVSIFIDVASKNKDPHFRVVWEYDESTDEIKGNVESFNAKIMDDYARFDAADKKQIDRVLKSDKSLSEVTVLGYFGFIAPIFRVISNDITSGKAYNINPSKVREPEDIAKVPGITFEGGGLASTLLALKKYSHADSSQREFPFMMFDMHPRFDSAAYEQIQEYCRLVSDDIIEIEARPDLIENKNRVFVAFDRDRDKLSLPISFVSDGTAKWLALMAAIVTSRSAFCIEEPENFLHPKLQQEIVSISRAVSEQSTTERFVLMTTHSQTLLNELNPSEVIVTSRQGLGTTCRRPANAAKIHEMINKTGFGLGHFYLTGAIE